MIIKNIEYELLFIVLFFQCKYSINIVSYEYEIYYLVNQYSVYKRIFIYYI